MVEKGSGESGGFFLDGSTSSADGGEAEVIEEGELL